MVICFQPTPPVQIFRVFFHFPAQASLRVNRNWSRMLRHMHALTSAKKYMCKAVRESKAAASDEKLPATQVVGGRRYPRPAHRDSPVSRHQIRDRVSKLQHKEKTPSLTQGQHISYGLLGKVFIIIFLPCIITSSSHQNSVLGVISLMCRNLNLIYYDLTHFRSQITLH